MNFKALVITLASILASSIAIAQVSLPVMEIGGKKYYYYQVVDKESLHGIAQKTGIPVATISEYNPSASASLTKKQLLLVPTDFNKKPVSEVQVSSSTQVQVYTLKTGENIYTVAKKFNSSIESILDTNIGLKPEQYTAGVKIKVVPNTALPFYYETMVTKFVNHTVGNNDTFKSIAYKYSTTEQIIQRLNPSINKPKKNKTVVVPTTSKVKVLGEMSTVTIQELTNAYSHQIHDIYDRLVAENRKKEYKVGIILPFQLHNPNAPKQAHLYTDFLKGFMIALDSLGHKASRKLNVKVFDTEHNLNKTDSLLALPQLQELNLIIAPGEPKQLERINAFGNANNIDILNCFSTKNEEYKDNSNVMLVNTPTSTMVNNLTGWFQSRFKDCTVLYLEDNDQSELFTSLKAAIASAGLPSKSLKVDSEFSFNLLSNNLTPGTNYVFVPSNSSKNLLKKLLPAMKEVKSERIDCDVNLLGYPEYVLYLKDVQSDLMTVDTYMFSRFFNAKGFRTRNVENSYTHWYGGTMLDSYPHMGLFGFDTGCYIINSLNDTPGESTVFKGIQTGFKFTNTNDGNCRVNQAITLVHFQTNKTIESFIVIDK